MVWFEHVTSPEYKERYRRLDPLRTASIRKADRCQSLKRQQDQALRYLLIAFLTARVTKIEACVLISQNSKTGAYHLSSRSTIKKENSADMKEKKDSHLPSILWRWIVDFGMKFLRFAGIFGHKCSSLKSVRVAIKLVSSIRQPLHSKTIVNGYNASRYLEFFFQNWAECLSW